jgi:diguanylate cyclase (GGDEF)-like protein
MRALFIRKKEPIKFGIAAKIGILLAVFGIFASGLTGYFSFDTTRQILSKKATDSMINSSQILGQRFSSMGHKVANDARFLARTKLVQTAVGNEEAAASARIALSDQFKSLLSVHPEFFQIRLISAQQYGIELVRVDRDDDKLVIISGIELQEKQHFPYVYETLKLPQGQAYFSKIFINREKGAHVGLGQPTLQVATPVVGTDGVTDGVIVINVDLKQMFSILKSDLSNEYQLYLTNQTGDYLIHPDPSKTFGFEYGRQFLAQNTFKPIAKIINKEVQSVTVHQFDPAGKTDEIGGFSLIPFGELTNNRFIIIGLTVPLDFVLAETNALIRNASEVFLGFSLLAIILSMLVAIIFVRPLKNLVSAVQLFSDKQQRTPLTTYSQDELGLLARSIEQMQTHILSHLNELNTKNTLLNREILERQKIELHEKFRSHVLELLAEKKPLNSILEATVLGLEEIKPGTICSILLLSEDDKHLEKSIAPNLPDFYKEALDGIEIGIGVGSCGTAAFTKRRVIVRDIQTDAYWTPYKQLANQAGLGSCWSQPFFSSSGKVLGTFAIYHHDICSPDESDINAIEQAARLASIAIEHKHAEDEINDLAFYDPLTHLPNRRLLLDRLKQAIATRIHTRREAALLFIDLDKFKALNDSLGHDMGDLLLQQIALRLKNCIRECDTISRLGGDEFVVILENLSEQSIIAGAQTETIGQKILQTLNQSYQLASHSYSISASIGATFLDGSFQLEDELMKQADIAMYEAKKVGGNRLYFFDPEMQKTVMARVQLEAELRDAVIKQEQFELYYQTQVDSTGCVIGAEALLRWKSPERGMVSPLEFIPVAEETGLILPLGHWVLFTACKQLATWALHPNTAHLTLAVNISAPQFRVPTFVEEILTLIEHTNINPDKLKLEITESILLDNLEDIVEKMTTLKAQGINFSIDDFGTGYSSLQYLKRLPLDQLKIDQSFVRDIENDSSDRAIVVTIILMAQSLNLDVIAEGVETEEQRSFLINSGCLHQQGFLYSKPIPIAEFNAALELNI